MIKLTYIVCVYNSSSTIIRTLESIYRQPIVEEEFEVIVVDDCSPDNSSELVTNFALTHTNLCLVRQKENHRVGTSMNIGIRLAKGIYIQVVDGDDVVGDGIIDTLNQCIEEGVDASINTSQFESADGVLLPMTIKTDLAFPMKAAVFCEKVFNANPIFGGTQFYMWRREFLIETNHFFVEDRKMEDTDWIEYHLFKAKTIGYSQYVTYTYLYNENSQLHKTSVTTTADCVLQSYRRLEGCKLYRATLPHFVSVITYASHLRVASSLRYRNLSKFWGGDFIALYDRIGDDVRKELAKYSYPHLARLFLRHKYITLVFLWSTVWMSHTCRFIVRFIRNIRKN